jgi:hypothetical protein
MQGIRLYLIISRYGDSLFFHFRYRIYEHVDISGHGDQVQDRNGDEDDGYDETILPVDYSRAGQIVDDVL